jgi:hypothetical protein
MICPVCHSEFRPGFTRCNTCDVDLVAELDVAPTPPPSRPAADPIRESDFVSYCGFLSLDDAREARDTLREEGLPCEIVIREGAAADLEAPVHEEYWLRVLRRDLVSAEAVLEAAQHASPGNGESTDGDTFACSECGEDVALDANACPHCGAQFEE